ncbi:hypothetical protein PGTUg99_012269 [Puccinia graminis f. sp. tritici]|uniref:Uncharacterized protein n=1 Tax=Puccinia graminis f. sp. tritici TaxID=56615 RepID=A0A5B0LKN8_PUCGR|nr:hypothetical protein PGTUg99_012269 [Puccinia graminis f. sp. tritici]
MELRHMKVFLIFLAMQLMFKMVRTQSVLFNERCYYDPNRRGATNGQCAWGNGRNKVFKGTTNPSH